MNDWTTDYGQLKSGDEFELEGMPDSYVVQNVQANPGGGSGMGEYPPTWNIDTNMGRFRYDPWAAHTYRRYRVVKSGVETTERPYLDVVYNDETLKRRRERVEREGQRKREEAENARLREEAMEGMTPEQRAAYQTDSSALCMRC